MHFRDWTARRASETEWSRPRGAASCKQLGARGEERDEGGGGENGEGEHGVSRGGPGRSAGRATPTRSRQAMNEFCHHAPR